MPIASHNASTTSASFIKRAPPPMLFTSFDIPEWTIPSSVIADSIALGYKHLFSSFEVPAWMLQGQGLRCEQLDAAAAKAVGGGGAVQAACRGRGWGMNQPPALSPSRAA